MERRLRPICESCAQKIKTVVLEIRVLMSFFREKNHTATLCIFH